MLPMPMRPDSDISSAWNDDTPASDFCPLIVRRSISPNPRSCMKRVRTEKYRPATMHRAISARLQTRLSTALMIAAHIPPVCGGRARQSVVEGKRVLVREDLGGGRIVKKQIN